MYSTLILTLSNLLVIPAVLLFHWDVWQIMFLFWFESVIIGLVHFLRFLWSGFSPEPALKNPLRAVSMTFLGCFFLLHFNGFNAGHLVFLVVLPPLLLYNQQPEFADTLLRWTGLSPQSFHQSGDLSIENPMQLAILAVIAIGHVNSFITHDVIGKDYRGIPDNKLMGLPYPRIFVMHLTMVVGATIFVEVSNLKGAASSGALVFLIVFLLLKLYFDIRQHMGMHKKAKEKRLELEAAGANESLRE